jgi:carbamoylphosphate synthase large subunit
MKKKVLLFDTNLAAKPIYDYLIKSHFELYVIGNNPEDVLAKASANYIKLDYRMIDNVIDIIKKKLIDYIVPGCNDVSYKVCSKINEKLNFYNIDSFFVNNTINNKNEFRIFSRKLKLNAPQLIISELEDKSYPAIVKPVDSYSGRGITKIQKYDKQELKVAKKHAINNSKCKSFVVEQYIDGQLYSHSAFLADGEVCIDFIVKEYSSASKYAVDTSYVVPDFSKKLLKDIRIDVQKIAHSLNLRHGLIHTQFILKKSKFYILEVTRRCPGDLYSLLIEYSTGFPYAKYYSNPFINCIDNIDKSKIFYRPVIRHTLSFLKQKTFFSFSLGNNIKVLNYFPLAVSGENVERSPDGKVGIVFVTPNNKDDFKIVLKSTIKRDLISYN